MTGLRRLRKKARNLIVISLAWEIAATLGSLVLLLIVMIQGGAAASSERLIALAGTLGIIGVVTGAIWQARRRRRRPEPEPTATAGEKI